MDARDWDEHADTYTRLFSPLTTPMAASMLRLAAPRLPRGARVLDVACGSGALALEAARRARAEGAGGTVLATDYAPAMVARVQEEARSQGLEGVLRAEVQDGMALDVASESFDAVFSSFGIFLFPDREAGWREAARALRPGGVFAATAWRGPEHNAMLRAQMGPLVAALPERLRPAQARSWMEIAEPAALVAEVARCGPFEDVEVHVLWGSIVLPGPRETWAAMRSNPVVGGLVAGCTPGELAAVEASVVGCLAAIAGGEGRPFALEASCHVVLGRKAASEKG